MTKNSTTSPNSLIDTLVKLGGLLGFLATWVSFFLQAADWLQNPRALRIASLSAFLVYLLATLWFAFKARNVTSPWRWLSLAVLYVFTALYFTWVGTWLIKPAPMPIVIDDMTGVSVWSAFEHGGSSLIVSGVTDRKTHALELDYTVEKDGWVAIHREINPAALAGSRLIGFSFRGSGAPNSIEFKLFRKPDENGRSAIFGVVWNHATNTDGWRYVEAPYSLFVCWRETGCQPGEVLDPSEVWKIDIAIANKAGDTPGSGVVLISPILGVP